MANPIAERRSTSPRFFVELWLGKSSLIPLLDTYCHLWSRPQITQTKGVENHFGVGDRDAALLFSFAVDHEAGVTAHLDIAAVSDSRTSDMARMSSELTTLIHDAGFHVR